MKAHLEEIMLVDLWAQSNNQAPVERDFVVEAMERFRQRRERGTVDPDDPPSLREIYELAIHIEHELTGLD